MGGKGQRKGEKNRERGRMGGGRAYRENGERQREGTSIEKGNGEGEIEGLNEERGW